MQQIEVTRAGQVERQGRTSKGDQPKWLIDNVWYKADHMGYESLAEVVTARMLQRSGVSDFVTYEPVRIETEDQIFPGCASLNFRRKGQSLIPLERLHRACHGEGLAATLGRLTDARERLRYTVNFVVNVTGLATFGRYLATMLELDAFLLNEDRHTNNITLLRDESTKAFSLCPLFDHGLSLLSDLHDYPLDWDFYRCIDRVKAKPFSKDFSEQAETAVSLYGSNLHFSFTHSDIPWLLNDLDALYDAQTLQRAEYVIREQMRKYQYLFS